MFGGTRRGPSLRGLAAGAWLCVIAGCLSAEPLERAGVALKPPPGWRAVPLATWPVPGRPLAAWSGPGGASLVVYRSLPEPRGRASALAEGLVNRLHNPPCLRVVVRAGGKVR